MPKKQKLGSLKYQVTERLKKIQRFGESKHQAKQEYRRACEASGIKWNPAKANGIFSYKTMDSYRQTALEFVGWLKQNHHEIRDLNAITPQHAKEYLLQRQDEGKTAWTLSKDMSAINKLFNTNLTKVDVGLHERSYHDVIRSRGEKEHDNKYNPENYRGQIIFAKASGCRRQSILKVKPEDFKRDPNGIITHVHLVEKGGRERDATILQNYRDQLTVMVNSHELGQAMFNRYTSKIDNHAYRAEYAVARYYELIQQKEEAGEETKHYYRGYDRECIQQVSHDLGHNRLSVVVDHYIR